MYKKKNDKIFNNSFDTPEFELGTISLSLIHI